MEQGFRRFQSLPPSWQRAVLRRCGGTGDETVEDLKLGLLPPIPNRKAGLARKIQRKALARLDNMLSSQRERLGEKLPYTNGEQKFLTEKGGQEALDELDALEVEHLMSEDMRKLGRDVSNACKGLKHIDEKVLHLLAADDDEITVEADARAAARAAMKMEEWKRWRQDPENIPRPTPDHPREHDVTTHKRRVRREINQASLHAAQILRLIGGPPRMSLPAYADNWMVARYQEIQARTQQFLKSHEIVTEDGEHRVSLADVREAADHSQDSKWYAMIHGVREQAERREWVPVFLTLTLPPQYHPHPKSGRQGDISISPVRAAEELQRRWHCSLSMLHQRGVYPAGIRVIEPHEDGCPHAHAVLWLPEENVVDLQDSFGLHFPATTEEEKGAREDGDFSAGPAVVCRRANPGMGAVHYAMAYVLKSLRRANAPEDDEDPGHVRAAAFARHLGKRRLSLVGLPKGMQSQWQSIQRTISASANPDIEYTIPAGSYTSKIARAWERRQWGTVIQLLGGFAIDKKEILSPIREPRENCWGDIVYRTTGYVRAGGFVLDKHKRLNLPIKKDAEGGAAYLTPFHIRRIPMEFVSRLRPFFDWEIVPIADDDEEDELDLDDYLFWACQQSLSFNDSYPRAARSAPPGDPIPPPGDPPGG